MADSPNLNGEFIRRSSLQIRELATSSTRIAIDAKAVAEGISGYASDTSRAHNGAPTLRNGGANATSS